MSWSGLSPRKQSRGFTSAPSNIVEAEVVSEHVPSGASVVEEAVPMLSVNSLGSAPVSHTFVDGDKFLGGFGVTELQTLDYWTLRARSGQLFNTNPYARGIFRRLITNEINTGLSADSTPNADILGMSLDAANDWSESVNDRFTLWGKNKSVCCFLQARTFGALQRAARLEAIISGDVLVVLRMSPVTRLPMVQLISGSMVQTPLMGGIKGRLKKGHKITHGVETDRRGRVVAHWVRQANSVNPDGTVNEYNTDIKRLAARGEKSGRLISWLVYGTDKRLDELRGQPLLAIILQSLKELDRYRDSTQRKAVINSILAMFVTKSSDKPSTLPLTGGAVRKDTLTATDSDGSTRNFKMAQQIPGLVIEELQEGEKPEAFGNQGTDVNYGTFESAMLQAMAWAYEIPPEILQLSFSNNYSASQAAINEFKIYLNKRWCEDGEDFCGPIHTEWLISEVLNGNIVAPGLLSAWRDPREYAVFGAWISTEWYGSIKPSTDMVKQAKGSKLLIEMGLTTRNRESRGITGTKYPMNIKKLARENQQLVDAMRPIAEFNKEFNITTEADSVTAAVNDLEETINNGE